MKPRYVTFTGFDKFTDIRKAVEISLKYPVEYGFLFSPTKVNPMYHKKLSEPGRFMLSVNQLRVKVSAHLCGGYAQMVNNGEDIISILPELEYFSRWQINSLGYNLENCAKYAVNGREIILQSRLKDHFPLMPYPSMYWLYDCSGGRGITPNEWPPQGEANQFVGYAGGINPDNILDVYEAVRKVAYSYWLDMESGVRTNGLFDLQKVEEVCRKLYD